MKLSYSSPTLNYPPQVVRDSFFTQGVLVNFSRNLVAAVVSTVITVSAFASDITGAGATFPYPVYSKWAEAFKAKSGVGVNYQSIGSSGGIKQIKAKTVDFGATDAPLKADEVEKEAWSSSLQSLAAWLLLQT